MWISAPSFVGGPQGALLRPPCGYARQAIWSRIADGDTGSGGGFWANGSEVPSTPIPESSVEPIRASGGAKIGAQAWWATNWVAPLAAIVVDREAMYFSVPFSEFVLPKSEVQGITRRALGLRIKHTVLGAPRYIVFYSGHDDDLAQALVNLGYPVCGAR